MASAQYSNILHYSISFDYIPVNKMILSWIPWSFILAFFGGALCLILVEVTIIYYLFFRSTNNGNTLPNTPSVDGYTFPQQLLELITEKLGENTSEGTVLLNLLLQFWFHENRYDLHTLTMIANKINSELAELLSNTSLGRIFNSLKIHDIELGSESPTISAVSLQKVDINKKLSTLNNFVFEFNVNYVGGFYMAIDALMKFNSNTAFVSVKVVKCIGRVRVEFTRVPYTYWCMSFISPPELELLVESRLEGHSVPQLNRIIGIQLRRRINRKFVMPFYKIRSKPFLPTHHMVNIEDDPNETIPPGKLHITIFTLSRIAQLQGTISCTLVADTNPWLEDVQSTANQMYIMQIFRRSHRDIFSNEYRKLSTGSLWYDRNADGLRHRLKSMTGQDDLSNIDEITRRKSFADASSLFEKLSLDAASQGEVEEANIYQTKKVPYSELMTFIEQYKFVIGPSTRYLNVLVWNHVEEMKSDNFIGYVSVPITNLIREGIGRKCRIFYLNPPNQLRNHAYISLSTHPGFVPSLCYGDIMLGAKFTFLSASIPNVSLNERNPVSLSPTKNIPPSIHIPDLDPEFILSGHDFERIIINKQTKCGFCFKKIWFKEASQCTKCALICHKKCVTKCEKSSECRLNVVEETTSENTNEIRPQTMLINPEIITTASDNNGLPSLSKNKLGTFFANVKGIRRSGSASSLAPPSSNDTSVNHAYSLPQTPSHSPCSSRKLSIIVNNVKLFQSEASDDEVERALNQLIVVPQTEQFLESMKDSGKKLCIDMAPDEREIRINEMLSKIKCLIDAETTVYSNLEEQRKKTTDEHELTKVILQMGNSEQRLQGLTNLMLYCCSGLQDSQHKSHSP